MDLVKDIGAQEASLATKEQMTQAARLGLRLFEDLTAVATGGPVSKHALFALEGILLEVNWPF